MRVGGRQITPFFVAVILIFATTAAVFIGCLSCSAQKLTFKSSFYFVCYRLEENYVSAASVSGAVENYGGAGYILNYDGGYYVTVACYYSSADASSVCNSLSRRDFKCFTLEVETEEYPIKSSEKKNVKLYEGNLTTLQSLSCLAYECANGLDSGKYDQVSARGVLDDIDGALSGLQKANASNCFTEELTRLKLLLADVRSGRIYPKDLRALQIAICDTIINIKLY